MISLVGHFMPILAVIFPVLVIVGLFGDVQGHSSPNVAFAWHPIFMSIAFPCLMFLGRWSYVVGATDWGIETKKSQRILHGAIMGVAVLVMLAGYACIITAHYPNEQFFGYNFRIQEWTQWKRVLHVYSGYVAILLTLQQAFVGTTKFIKLQNGTSTHTFHGRLGKVTILTAGFSLLMAIWFWGWSIGIKKAMFVVLALIMCAVVLVPTPPPKPEESKLVEENKPVQGQSRSSGSGLAV